MKHLLVVRFSAMGDVSLTAPVIQHILAQNPNVKITLVSRPQFAPFFQENDRLSFRAVDLKNAYSGILGMYRLFRELRQEIPVSALIDLHSVLRTWLLRLFFMLSGIPTFGIDKGRTEKKQLTRKNNKRANLLKHSTERYLEVFARAGYTGSLQPFLWSKNNLAAKNLEKFFAEQGIGGKVKIGVAPFAAHRLKELPLEKIKSVVAKIYIDIDADIFVFGGGKREQTLVEGISSRFPQIINVCETLDLGTELALMGKLDLMISMDSSNMHMAALAGTKVVSIWGPTHSHLGFGALYQPPQNSIEIPGDQLSCRPCSVFGNKPCWRGDHACMQKLEVDDIYARIKEVLKY